MSTFEDPKIAVKKDIDAVMDNKKKERIKKFENQTDKQDEKNEKSEENENSQGELMETFIEREYGADADKDKQGEAMESFLKREYGEGIKKEDFKKLFKEVEVLERKDRFEKLKEINPDLKNALEKMLDPSTSREDFYKIIGDFNEANMKEKEGTYNSVDLDEERITVKYYENGSFSISGRYNEEREIIESRELEGDVVELEDLEDKELTQLLSNVKKTRKDYLKNKQETQGGLAKIKKILGNFKTNEDFTSSKDSKSYFDSYYDALSKLLDYQAKKLQGRNLPEEKLKIEINELTKYYNSSEEKKFFDKNIIKYFEIPKDEAGNIRKKTKKEARKERYANIIKKKNFEGMLKKYKINEKGNFYEQSSTLLDQLVKEISMSRYANWEKMRDKEAVGLINEKNNFDQEGFLDNIQKTEKYFVGILGESAKFKKGETIRKWITRITKETLESNK